MKKISASITRLQIGKKNLKSMQKMSAKLSKQAKNENFLKNIKTNADFSSSYKTIDLEKQPQTDEYISRHRFNLDMDKYSELAPWNPVFQKFKTIILYKK